jgi:hypothetical protein
LVPVPGPGQNFTPAEAKAIAQEVAQLDLTAEPVVLVVPPMTPKTELLR